MFRKLTMASAVLGMTLASLTLPAAALKTCTDAPMDKWMKPEQVKAMLEEKGYKVRKVKVEGTCLEAYAMKDGQKVEIYMDPVTGEFRKVKMK